MPVADDRAHGQNRRLRADPDQDDHGRGHCDWRRRVHDDAQRAVVGIGIEGMEVRHLGHGQQR
jgi:hypothetical protein